MSFAPMQAKSEAVAKSVGNANRARIAAQDFANGELALADSIARSNLELEPNDVESLNLLGLIAARLELYDDAARYFERVLKNDPLHPTAGADLQEALAAKRSGPSKQSTGNPKYLVIRPWGCGFWSDMSHVLGCLLLAEITGRIPVTYWGKGSRFSDGSDADAFQFYFKPVSSVSLDDLRLLADATYFPAKRRASNLRAPAQPKSDGSSVEGLFYLNRPETVAISDFFVGINQLVPWIPRTHELADQPLEHVYRWLAEKYLHPHEAVLTEVENSYRALIAGRPTIAVHFRGLDKGKEVEREELPTPQDYFDILDRENPSMRIFLLSDDDDAIATFRGRYGERVVFTACQRASGEIGLHYRQSSDRIRLGREVMVDVYLALRCDKFLGLGMSNVSNIIEVLRPWEQGTCTLLGQSVLRIPLNRIRRRDAPIAARSRRPQASGREMIVQRVKRVLRKLLGESILGTIGSWHDP